MAWFTKQAAKGTQLAVLFSIRQTRVPSLPANLSPILLRSSCHRRMESSSSSSSPSQSVPLPASDSTTTATSADFRTIYTFRFIVHTRVLSRLKIYQTLLTLGALPPAVVLHNGGVLSAPGLASFFGVASLATVMLYVMSNWFRRVVGMISLNDKEGVVRISHLTFWGRRHNADFELSSIVPLSDMSVKASDVYQVVNFYDQPVKFYWFFRHAKNADLEGIERVFGRFF